MIINPSKKTSGLKSRREIQQVLAAFRLERKPRRLLYGENADFAQARISRLRAALECLGPIFSSFGLYMSSRIDLWSAQNCLELASIPDRSAAAPIWEIKRLLSCELEHSVEQVFSSFEDEPFESRLFCQAHHGRLKDGTKVIVEVIRPETEHQLSGSEDVLMLLRGAFADLSDSDFKGAVADFCQTLTGRMDFGNDARAFEVLAQDAEEYPVLRAPRLYEPLCTSRVLTTEKLDGLSMAQVLSSIGGPATNAEARATLGHVGLDFGELARLLCEVWLRQALLGRCFPIEPGAANIVVLPGKQIAFIRGPFARLALGPKANLWDYLIAAANEDPDKACSCLLKEMRRKHGSVKADEVRQRLRQAIVFRDGGWDSSEDNQSLAELLFVQWRFANQSGYLPLTHLLAFYRGLFTITDIARRLTPQSDPLAEGVRDLRLLLALAQFRRMFSQQQLVGQIDRYAALMARLPQSLDEALMFVAEGHGTLNLSTNDLIENRAKRSSSAPVTALLLVLAAVALLSHYIDASEAASAWPSRINAIVFLLLGGLLLKMVSQGE